MKRVYNCVGVEKVCLTNPAVPVFHPDRTYSAATDGETDQTAVRCNNNLEHCLNLLKTGYTIGEVSDCPVSHDSPHRILRLKPDERTQDPVNFCLPRHVRGPVKRFSLIPFSESDILYFSDETHVFFVKETSRISVATTDAHVTVDATHVNLKTRHVTQRTFDIPHVLGLGSHFVVTHGAQLFICYDNPIRIHMVDFSSMHQYTYASESTASRFLTCNNFVVALDNHNHPDKFICITMTRNEVHHEVIAKHQLFIGADKFALPMVVNVRGRVLWLAHNEDILTFLTITDNELREVAQFPFNNCTNANKMNVLIKNMFCFDDRLLFVPMMNIDKNTIGSECAADSYEVVVVDLHAVKVLYVLRTQCKVDVYTDYVDMHAADCGTSLVVKKMRKSNKTLGGESFEGHVFHLKASSLMEMALRSLVHNFPYEHVREGCPKNVDLLRYYYR